MVIQQQQRQVQGNGIVGQFLRVFSDTGSNGVVVNPRTSARRALHLRTGDTIPCDVTSIDERGVTFATTISEATFVPHEKIKALELVNEQSIAKIDREKRDRLLTLPRMQRENPPTHLIRSRSGDYLRGRLLAMDEKDLKVEVRLETKTIPRDRVSRIIWLHDDELETVSHADNDSVTRVQAVRRDGIRLTFFPKSFVNATLSGESDVLGPCHVELNEIDQLLIGRSIEQEAAMLAFQQWKLQNAKDPRAFVDSDGSSGSPNPGTESPLVGQAAPDFQLGMLDDSIFKLQEYRGKVLVLDFWATWCGPCMQTMPEVDAVVAEFKDQNVQLIAVNLHETPDRIKDMLERRKLQLEVALDLDGAVAEKYRVNAIPQTVIIDRAGNVARCFIGGGSHFADDFRAALQAVVDDKAAETPMQ
jgi:peroxiredoxin